MNIDVVFVAVKHVTGAQNMVFGSHIHCKRTVQLAFACHNSLLLFKFVLIFPFTLCLVSATQGLFLVG